MSRCPLRTAIWRADSPRCTELHEGEDELQNTPGVRAGGDW